MFLSAWYEKWTWLHYDKAEDHVLCIICKNVNDHEMLNNVKVEDSFVKTGYSNWKNPRSAYKGFQKHEFFKCHQRAIQKLVIFDKNNVMSLLYLSRQGSPFRGHGDDKDSNFKQLLNFCGEEDLAFVELLKKKNQTYTVPEI